MPAYALGMVIYTFKDLGLNALLYHITAPREIASGLIVINLDSSHQSRTVYYIKPNIEYANASLASPNLMTPKRRAMRSSNVTLNHYFPFGRLERDLSPPLASPSLPDSLPA